MSKLYIKFPFLALAALLVFAAGCFDDLNTEPLDPDEVTSLTVYDNPAAYRQVLAKLYAGYAVSGQQGPAGQADIAGIDEGFGQYLRGFWYHQELSTDEAIIGWNDQTIKDFHWQTWTSTDGFIYAFYSRIFYQIALVNEYLRETSDGKLDDRGVDANLRNEIKRYRAEARFLRALSYWHGLDLFRNTPFATEDQAVGTFTPARITGPELFDFIESELKAIDADLADPRTNEYARADKAAAWFLLAKLYLNAEVYGKGNRYADCLQYCERILGAGYQLHPVYDHLFMADNDRPELRNEIIFPVAFDGVNTRTYGGTTFIIRAGIGGTMDALDSGQDGGWGGVRTTKEFVAKFPQNLTGVIVDFNEGNTERYSAYYVTASHIGFDSAGIAQSIKISANTVGVTNKFEGHIYFPNDNSEFLFRRLPSQSFSPLGDNNADGVLETNGARIKIPTAGLYYLTLDVSNSNNRTYTVEKRDWNLIGSATQGAALAMTFNPATNQLEFTGDLKAGGFKFRPNLDDAKSLGDNGADALLETGGADIQIDEEGNYTIYLDVDRPDYTYKIKTNGFDRRAKFYTDGQDLEIDEVPPFTEGYAIRKFTNIKSDGGRGKDLQYPDTDFPMFRLADVYLMAAEAILRGGGGSTTQAVEYVNKVRERAYAGKSGNIDESELTLNYILDERARELYWECHRRTDLVRFGQFTNGTYVWAWKGNVKEGATVPPYRNIYPIPAQDLNTNPNLRQNDGY
ncbi:MAG: RagB/SusD family nutrient uptake outer membrane protein [Saprospiraceae bacterium]|nr:RagB/SusD family nutrient uptake outer membrane protein [Saprospiraceae bacterium]